jgi:acetolactate synthase-1/2/3 large subunit
MKASDYIIEYIINKDITKIYGYIGGAIAHLANSLYKNKKIEMVNAIHEQGAGFAAEGYARATGKIGIAMATSGPGATNLVTPIGSCFFDSIPTVFITGQVNTYEYKYEKPVRQIGFQETDIVSIIKPITKYAVMVSDINDLRYEIEKCFYIAAHGRKGPVLIDIPMNIQRTEADFNQLRSFFDGDEYKTLSKSEQIDKDILHKIQKMINNSSRPVMLLGGGIRLSNACKELKYLIETTNIPIVHSLMGTDCIDSDYKYNQGLIGAYGNRYGNFTLANADVILVLGSRLDTRQTGTDLKTFARSAKVIHVDIDENELGDKVKVDIHVKSDIKDFLTKLNKFDYKLNIENWQNKCLEYKRQYPSTKSIDNSIKKTNLLISEIFKNLNSEDVICVDVGQHQMWVAQSGHIKEGQRVLFSGGMGSMGFAFPAAIGASIGTGKRSIVITGDGGMQMNIQELEIIKRRNLPVKIFVINNQNLGMVRQFQELYFEGRLQSTVEDYSVPDFAKITNAYGLNAKNINYDETTESSIKDFLKDSSNILLNIIIEKYTTVEPKLIVNYPIEDMHPFLDRDEFTTQMLIDPVKGYRNV